VAILHLLVRALAYSAARLVMSSTGPALAAAVAGALVVTNPNLLYLQFHADDRAAAARPLRVLASCSCTKASRRRTRNACGPRSSRWRSPA
jgi:hypothetical protein